MEDNNTNVELSATEATESQETSKKEKKTIDVILADASLAGKTCPFCKTDIKEGEEIIVCPACNTPHHKGCWEENKGCTTFGCSEQHYEEQHTNPTDVCANCGAPLGDGQAFCPKCGTAKPEKKQNVCSKCGAELKEDQEFCSKCGQKAGLQIDENVNSAISQFNANVNNTNKKKNKKPVIIGVVAVAAIVIGILVFKNGGIGTKDFNKMYSDISDKSWCEIASDGTWMKIDTNPYDIDDYYDSTAVSKVKSINSELGFSSSVYQEMLETRALDGRQSASCDKYEVSWSYHPDKGMEIMYKVKN